LIAVDKKTMPAEVDGKVCTIAVDAVSGAYINERLVLDTDSRKNIQKNPVFFELRIYTESRVSQGASKAGADCMPVEIVQEPLVDFYLRAVFLPQIRFE
jgi:hypothetical protein